LLTVACDYGAADLERRVLALLGARDSAPTIEAVERAFALPRLRTSFDDPRIASFDLILAGAPGHGSWQAMLNFTEGFYPTDAARRPRFRGGERPALIDPRRRGDLRFDVRWLKGPAIAFGRPGCLTEPQLERAAKRAGWRVERMMSQVMDAADEEAFVLRRGKMQAGAGFDRASGCIDDFSWTRPADPGAR